METPEGVSLALHPAGPPARLLAFAIDASLRFAAYFGALIAIVLLDSEFAVSIFLLDRGRRMLTSEEEGGSHFDAVMVAAQVALRQGDSVGCMTFGGERRWLAPRKGVAQQNALLNALYDLEPGADAADYTGAAHDLLLHVRKRTLVICVSNLRDEDTDELQESLALLARRDLVLLVSLRETALTRALASEVKTLSDALRAGATRRYLELRAAALRQHSQHGAILLDMEPESLPVALVNRYLDVKVAGLL